MSLCFPINCTSTFQHNSSIFCDEMMQIFVSVCLLHLTQYAIFVIWIIKIHIKDLTWNEISSRRFNNPLFPKSIRGILVGKISMWENHFAIEFLLRPGWLDFKIQLHYNCNSLGSCSSEGFFKIRYSGWNREFPKTHRLYLYIQSFLSEHLLVKRLKNVGKAAVEAGKTVAVDAGKKPETHQTPEILKFSEKPVVDESCLRFVLVVFHEYEPQARTNLNSAGEININIELQVGRPLLCYDYWSIPTIFREPKASINCGKRIWLLLRL